MKKRIEKPVEKAVSTRLAEFDNVVIRMAPNGHIMIDIDPAKELGPSKSGKTTLIASTGGNKDVRGTDDRYFGTLGLNFYKK